MSEMIYAKNEDELRNYLRQLHDTCSIRKEKFIAKVITQGGVRTLAGKVPARMGHRDTTHSIGEKYIKLKP